MGWDRGVAAISGARKITARNIPSLIENNN
jgi:hypothetical protein